MNLGLIILGVCAFGAFLTVVIVIALRNGIVSSKNRVKRGWADVITYQRKKIKIIPALEQGLKDHKAYEGGVLKEITALRASVSRLSEGSVDVGQLQEVSKHSKAVLSGLQIAVEAYPNLKTSELYASWMRELSEAEENIAAAIVIFNGSVHYFNDRIQLFPGNVVNSWLNHETALDKIEYKPTFSV